MNPPLNSKPMTISNYVLAHLNKYSSHLCWPCYPDPNPKFQFVSTACSTLKIHGIMMLPVLSVGHTAQFLTTFAELFPLVGSVAINADRLIDIFFPTRFHLHYPSSQTYSNCHPSQPTLCQTSFDSFWSSTNLSIVGFDSTGRTSSEC